VLTRQPRQRQRLSPAQALSADLYESVHAVRAALPAPRGREPVLADRPNWSPSSTRNRRSRPHLPLVRSATMRVLSSSSNRQGWLVSQSDP
jgi:hypothetical protein